jgi:hypothetical protein
VILPSYAVETRAGTSGRTEVLDLIRRRWVHLSPEEGVRQHLLRHLLALGYPAGLMAVERGFSYMGQPWRADVVAYDRARRPLILAECKAPRVLLGQAVLDQLARYNAVVHAQVLVLTNGHDLAVGAPAAGIVRRLPSVPAFASLAEGADGPVAAG